MQSQTRVQDQHIKRKGADGVGDDDDAFSPVPAVSSFCTIFSLATQFNMFTDHVDISPVFVQGELQPIPHGVTFSKAQSSKLELLFCHVSVKRDVRALSFEL